MIDETIGSMEDLQAATTKDVIDFHDTYYVPNNATVAIVGDFDTKDAQAMVPALRVDDLIAAVWGPQDGLAGPAEVTQGFAKRARELGAERVIATASTADKRDLARDVGRRYGLGDGECSRRRALRTGKVISNQ